MNRIRCRINENKSKIVWITIAHQCVNEYDDTLHSVTKFAPSYLMCGKIMEILPNEIRERTDFWEDKNKAFQNSLKDHNLNKQRLDKKKTYTSI